MNAVAAKAPAAFTSAKGRSGSRSVTNSTATLASRVNANGIDRKTKPMTKS